MGTVEKIDSTKQKVERRAGDVLAMMIRGAEAAAGIGSLVRHLDRRSMQSWLPFRRRRSVWGTLGLLGAGALAGAGLSMLLSPMSGQDLRQNLKQGFRRAEQKGKEVLEEAENEIADLAKGAEKQISNMTKRDEGQEKPRESQRGNKTEQKGPGNATSGPMGGTMGTPGRHA